MSGFPTRFLRSQLGPQLRNNYPVENPETDIGDATFNAAFWQIAGMNLVVPRATLVATWNGVGFDIGHQAEAWNADGAQLHPELARVGPGHYTYTFAPTYRDEDDVEIATALHAARVSVQQLTGVGEPYIPAAFPDTAEPLVVRIRIFEFLGSAADAPFWLEVL